MVSTSVTRSSNRAAAWPITRSDVLVGVLLVVVMLTGGYMRFMGQNWDDYTHLHPDERFLTGVASAMGGAVRSSLPTPEAQQAQINACLARYPATQGIGGFFDAECSTWNPHNTGPTNGMFVYGTLPLFMARSAAELLVEITGNPVYTGYNGIHLVWRALSALAETATILVLFLIGLRLHGRWVGLLAAALYAAAVFSIQQAHFGTADAIGNFFTVLAIFFAVRVFSGAGWLDYAAFGLALAAALASRINMLPLAGLIVLAALVRLLPILDSGLSWRERERLLLRHGGGVVLAGVLTLVGFRFMNPYTFMGPGILGLGLNARWFEDIAQARHLVSGAAEMPPNWQWVARTAYIFPLTNIVLWGMGLALGVTAWLGWLWSGYRLITAQAGAMRNLLPFVWVLVYFGWLGSNWVMSMRYFLPLYAMLALLAAWALVALIQRAQGKPLLRLLAVALLAGVVGFTYLWAAMFTNIYRNQLTRVQASHWVWENVSGDFSMRLVDADAPLINIPIPNGFNVSDDPVVSATSTLYDGQVFGYTFTAPADGTVTSVYAPHMGEVDPDPTPETVRVTLREYETDTLLAEGQVTANLSRDNHVVGDSYEIALDNPVTLRGGERYTFTAEVVEGGPVMTSGEIVSHEGAWDDSIPYSVCTLPYGVTLADNPPPGLLGVNECNGRNAWSGLLNGYEMQLSYEDEAYKRDLLLTALNNSDYLTISSNRFYDSVSRIPMRWPMTNAYYNALFNGELGYELVALFQETFELGPLRVSDQHLPIYDSPAWLNELEAEEAFHVYDHPAVFIFRKTDNYDAEAAARLLNSVPMNRVGTPGTQIVDNCPEVFLRPGGGGCSLAVYDTATLSSLRGDQMPTQLMLTPERRAIQYTNGTWSERFDSDSIINTQPVVTILAWWIAVTALGLIVWPLLFVMFPSFADRGYSFARFAGLLLTGWLAWYGASAGLATWSQVGIFGILLILAAVSLLILVRRRADFGAYLRQSWSRLAWIEILTLLAFMGFLVVRLTNPDLWHQVFGGEKPMDFAYFNGVLRSTIFPAIDPWHAGGYLNYYYFGFIIVGVPVLLLQVVPSIGYNLLLPTLFAVTGMAAFGVAFNLVAHWREQRPSGAVISMGSPWIAGIMALLLAVVVGNLDTPRVFGTGIAQLGGYERPESLEQFLAEEYTQQTGAPPDDGKLLEIRLQAQNADIFDRLRYEVNNSTELLSSLGRGMGVLLAGQGPPIAANRWYWGPTRVLAETPGVEGNAITEIPYFTFLYGDLHAHMIAMPMMLFVMAFLLNEVLVAGRDPRSRASRWLALAFGAGTAGLLRATNTWDWPTFMLLSVLGLGFAWWLAWQRIDRRSVWAMVSRIGGFVVLSVVISLPYISWYAAIYNSASLWQGGKTPLWAYFDIHGLFIFLIFSLLAWDTWRWFRVTYVRELRGLWPLLLLLLIGTGALLFASLVAALAGYQVALIVVPMILWIAVLFLRPGQAREMQYALALAALALAITLGVEIIVLDGDIGRQNTVFKFYIQVWLLFSVVGGAAFAWLIESAPDWSGWVRNVWYVVGAVLFAVAALYPVMATQGRAQDRMAPDMPFTLDGMDYMQYALYSENGVMIPLADDYRMIRWLQENVEGTPVIIEGQSWREYLWSGRVAIYTGLPTVQGWRFHQTQQRTFDPLPQIVNQRRANVNAFYSTTDIQAAWDIIQAFDIEYIIVGGLERAYYPAEGLAKFETMAAQGLLEEVYRDGETQVFRVNLNAIPARVQYTGME